MNIRNIPVFVLLILVVATPRAYAKSEKKSPQIELVRKLYKAFAWEAVMPSEESDILIDQPKDVLKAYFEPTLVDLLVADRECARKEGSCKLDKHPLFGVENPIAHGLEISQGDSASIVRVQFNWIDGSKDELVDVQFRMAMTKNGWRVGDVVYENGPSLKVLLKGDEEPKDEDDE